MTPAERETAILALVPQVEGAAKAWARRTPVEYDDLKSVGMLGAIAAVDLFDASKGLHIKTYADWKIRSAIRDYLRRCHLLAGVRTHKNWDVTILRIRPRRALHQFGEGEVNPMLVDTLPAPGASPEALAIRSDLNTRMQAGIRQLRPNRRVVIAHMLAGERGRTAAAALGINESRVSQLRTSAVKHLQHVLAA